MLVSWKAAKYLNILPECYPHPINVSAATHNKHLHVSKVHTITTPSCPTLTSKDLMKEFATVFDGVIKTMEGKKKHISLEDNAKLFCVNTPRSIPFTQSEKL